MAQGVITACVAGGMMIGSMFSATVLSPWLGGWQRVMYFYGGFTFLLGVVWLLTAPDHARSQVATHSKSPFAALKHVLKRRNIWFVAIAMLAYAGGNKGVMGYLPLYLRNAGWTTAAADGAMAALNATGMIAAVPFTLFSDRLGLRKSVLIPGVILSGIGVFLLWRVTGAGVWPLAMLAGLFRDVIWAVAATMAVETEGIGPEYAGIAVGIVHSFTRLGYTFTPPLGNSLALIQPGLPFVFWAGLCLVALVAFLLVGETGRLKKQGR
jgi:predicted MFS family arabinose efflux permease